MKDSMKSSRNIVFLFFIIYFVVGVYCFDDYGISWDEPFQRDNAVITANYVLKDDPFLFSFRNRYYGTFFEMILFTAEIAILGATDNLRQVYLLRHFLTFLCFFIGVYFFYRLCNDIFHDWKWALVACFFLVVSPRIFSHSFYNSKDIPFLSFFIIAFYFFNHFISDPRVKTALLGSLTSAFAIDVRITGVLLPFFVMICLPFFYNRNKKDPKSHLFVIFLLYFSGTLVFSILFWPFLWKEPLKHLYETFTLMSRYPWTGTTLYVGEFLKASEIPWHYSPVWIIITTPPAYIFFFAVGVISFMTSVFKKAPYFSEMQRILGFVLLWLFLPILAVITLGASLYDAWRQLFFVYPAFIIFSTFGLFKTIALIVSKYCRHALVVIIPTLVSILPVLYFMVKHHPHQHVYFNFMAGPSMDVVKQRFELDYWGLSYRKALEYILDNDPRPKVKIFPANIPGYFNSLILPRKDRKRLAYVGAVSRADYFLTNYRWHPGDYDYPDECYSIQIGNAKIQSVFRVRSIKHNYETP